MSITLTADSTRVKQKCQITGTALDASISNIISEITPVVEFAIRDEALASTDSGLQSTIDLGVLEIVCAEVLEERVRLSTAAMDPGQLFLMAADRLRRRGWARLQPYLKAAPVDALVRV